MSTNPKPTTSKPQPKVVPNPEPIQEEFPFARQYNTLARAELEKDMETLLKHLDKLGCFPEDIDPIVSMVLKSSSRMRIQETERTKERTKAAEAKKKRDAVKVQETK